MRRFSQLFTLAVPFAAMGLAFVWVVGLASHPAQRFAYETTEVTRGPIRRVVTTSGPVRALVTVSVGSQLSGQIEEVRVDFNREVKVGDVLATIDAQTFQSKVVQAKADLTAAEAALLNQEAGLKKAEAVLKLADLNIVRQRKLAAKGYAAQATLDGAIRDTESGRADIAVAQAQIASAKAVIGQRKASLQQALIDLERAEIRSPIDGTVISRTVDPGQTVAASLQAPELFKIAQDLSQIQIEAQVNEADVGAIEKGNPAAFTVDAYPERQFEGKVTQVRLAATEINNVVTYTVIIEAMNSDRKLFPGMTANVVIETAKRDDVLRVANEAFRYRPRSAVGKGGRGRDPGARSNRFVGRIRDQLQLTGDQEAALKRGIDPIIQEARAEGGGLMGGGPDISGMRQRMMARAEQVLGPLLNEGQQELFENWKQGRETVRPGVLWVAKSDQEPDRKFVRAGIADDQFTEILGGDVQEGDKAIVRAREAKP